MTDEIAEDEPFAPFARWFDRAVLLKGADPSGFVFYTNMESRKAGELIVNPHAALCFHWKSIARQVRVEGTAALVSAEEADAYFATRLRDSQIGAWASDQSRPLESREALERRFLTFTLQYADEPVVPRPANWSGFRVCPERIEFWQEQPFRLHDRVVFVREGPSTEGKPWRKERLFP
jgi:pyridoxamine 5'-phosphate oxidase